MGQLSVLKRYSKEGQWLELTIMSNTGENKVEGFLLELDDFGVVLKNNGRIVYQPAEVIRSFVVDENKTMATIDENSSNIHNGFLATEFFVAQKVTADLQVSPVSEEHVSGPETTISQDITTETFQQPTVVESIVIESPKVQDSDNQTSIIPSSVTQLAEVQSFPKISAYAFVQFTNEVSLSPPEPFFIINGLNHEEQQELAKWKNKYEYAVKIHELSRIVNFLPEIMRWAVRVNSGEAYTLCGLLALKVEKFKESREMLEKAELRPDRLETVLSLSYLNIKETKWEETAKLLLHYVLLHKEGTFDNQTFIVLLGQCLAHLENRALQGLSTIYRKVTTELQNVAALVIAFALEKSHLQAAEAAIIGHLEQAKTLAPDSAIFEEVNFSPPIKLPPPTFIPSTPPYSYGRVSAVYLRDYGEFGFIIDNATKQTYYFRLSNIKDDGLYKLLQKNLVGQKVKFIPQRRDSQGKYDIAEEIVGLETAKTELSGEFSITTSSKSPQITLPKGDSSFAKACRAESSEDLDTAERLFDKQISLGGEYQLSAVKKLAQLRSRRGYDDEAINLLDKHRSLFGKDTRTLDNLRVAILIKARHFEDAIKMFDQFLKNATINREKITLHRQKAFCRYRQGRFDDAVRELEYILKKSPFDNVTRNLITQVKQARDQGIFAKVEESEETELAEWASGLSGFAQHLLTTCDFSYVDERSKARGFYDQKDFTAVENFLDRIRGKRPSEKAKVLLTLAAMCQAAPEVAGKRNLTDYLRRSLVFMGESVFNDELLHPDIARCYFTEALSLATIEEGARGSLTYLLATYLQSRPAPGELLSADGNMSLETVFKLLISDSGVWKNIQRDFPYYSVMSHVATTLLMGELKKGRLPLDNFLKSSKEWESKYDAERERLRQESNALLSLREQTYTGAGNFKNTATTLFNLSEQTLFETDKKRLKTLANIIANDASSYWSEEDFIERDNKHQRLINGVQTFSQDILKEPTKLSVERILPIADKIKEVVTNNFKDYVEKTQPTLELRSALFFNDYYNPDGNGVITIRVEIELKPGSAPIEGLSISVREMEGLKLENPASSPEPLKAGQCREVEIQVKPSPRQLEDKVFELYTILKYLTRSGKSVEKEETIKIQIGSAESFVEIKNPYKNYEGGSPVADSNMFKGREDLLERIANIVTIGAMGQCFVLYGQKRSGKTSILKQLEKRIKPPNLAVEVTLGVLDTTTEQTNFIQLCLDAIEDWNSKNEVLDLKWWPSAPQVKDSPIDTFRQTLRELNKQLCKAGWEKPRLILLVDEFTYIYEYITEGILSPTFMRMWKGLLQMQSFNAVVVGQDSIPKFKQAFANEFGVTHDERITYLSSEEAQRLAEEPILFEGKSRYRSNGRAMERLIKLTAGSPFYLQIFCDRIVRHLNERKAPFITELDIEAVKETLISGSSALPIEKFDPLITAAGESVAEANREVYLNLLTAIAKHSTPSGIGVRLPDLPKFDQRERLLEDMKDRDVIVTDAEGRISIRVELFTEWLRVNHAWNQTL